MQEIILSHLFEIVISAVLGLLTVGYRKIMLELGKQRTERMAIKTLLRSDLIKMHNRYMDKGEIPIYAQENVQEMYLAYHELGGNGAMTKLVQELMQLPTRK